MNAGRGFLEWTPESAQAVQDGLLAHLHKVANGRSQQATGTKPTERNTVAPKK